MAHSAVGRNRAGSVVRAGLLFMFGAVALMAPRAVQAQWALEGNVLWPVVSEVGIYSIKVTRGLRAERPGGGARTELLLGSLVRPGIDRKDEGRFSEYGLSLGARRYLGRRLHAELLAHPSYARLEKSVVNGRDYDGFAFTTEAYVGTRVGRGAWYLLPQAGVGSTLVQPDWPRPDDSRVFPVLNLIVGRSF